MAVDGKTVIDEIKLTNIGNAIRQKGKTTELIAPTVMPDAINALSPTSEPFNWSWNNAISNISVSADYAGEYEVYGDNLLYICLGAQLITLTNIDNHDNLIGWCNYLYSGGHATVLVKSGLLSDEEKTAIQTKGYTIVES